MIILLTDEDDAELGYVISKSIDSPRMYVMFWACDTPPKKVMYADAKELYDKSIVYARSELVDISPLHRAKFLMSRAFMRYYESVS